MTLYLISPPPLGKGMVAWLAPPFIAVPVFPASCGPVLTSLVTGRILTEEGEQAFTEL